MMNTERVIKNSLLIFVLLIFSVNVSAETPPFKVVEIGSSKIILAKDGTGIVKGIKCKGCDFNFVKITSASKASIQGTEVSILEVRKLKGKIVMVSFNPVTQEVQYIRW